MNKMPSNLLPDVGVNRSVLVKQLHDVHGNTTDDPDRLQRPIPSTACGSCISTAAQGREGMQGVYK